jgi:malonate decarboxylase epsilon subunit
MDDCSATTRGLLQPGGTLRVNTVLLFPGQGAQIPGMLHTLGKHPAVEETLHEISEALGCEVRTFDSPEER